MRPASASTLTSPSVVEAVRPLRASSSTRLSTPPHERFMAPARLCSLATPTGTTSETTTVTPAAARARAVELPMPTGLPQPVISATRAGLGIAIPPLLIAPHNFAARRLFHPWPAHETSKALSAVGCQHDLENCSHASSPLLSLA